MNITGKTNLFVAVRTTKDKSGKEINVKDLTTTISKKDTEGNYINATIEVKLVGDEAHEAKFKKAVEKMDTEHTYPIEITDGFLSFRTYIDKDEKKRVVWQLIVLAAGFESPIEIKNKKEATKKTTKKSSKAKAEKAPAEAVEDDDLPF